MKYEDSYLWKATLESKCDTNEEQRTILRNAYLQLRDNVSFLLDKIIIDFPKLTIHNITHADSLWNVSSVIIGENYPITSIEGFILGCSFLLHDAAQCYDAYGGVDKLRNTTEWKDNFSDISEKSNNKSLDEIKEETDFLTIRQLHSDRAKVLLDLELKLRNGGCDYLLQDETLRQHYKKIIGEVAASHNWDIDKVEQFDTQINAMPDFPREWKINPLKLACIIRCADAAHVDNGRAPDYLFGILKINGVSYDHWKAQNRLTIIDTDTKDNNAVIIQSTQDFIESDFNAWNVAYNILCVLDKELNTCNKLLESKNIKSFQARYVKGVNSQQEMSKYIKVSGWRPCSANIHVSNIRSLISNLGGEKLYGNEDHILIVIRELIQNARDAINARKEIEPNLIGKININVSKIDDDTYISIEDNGIGMSERVIKSSLLDFGTSFWKSDLSKIEFPGLRSSNFKSVGEFGIGFYSIFMIASSVSVSSKRFDKGFDSISTLKFPNGLTLTPILSNEKPNEFTSLTSTLIKFKIDPNKYMWDSKYTIRRNLINTKGFIVSFYEAIASLCASLDVDVYYQYENTESIKIHTNILSSEFDKKQWLKDISFASYQDDDINKYIDDNYNRLEPIIEGEKIVGLAALSDIYLEVQNFLNISTIGGLATSIHCRDSRKYIGYMEVLPNSAKRDGIKYIASDITLRKWANKQYEILSKKLLDSHKIYYISSSLCDYKIDTTDIACILFLLHDNTAKYIYLNDLVNIMRGGKQVVFLKASFSDDYMETHFRPEDIVKSMDINHLVVFPLFVSGNFLSLKLNNEMKPIESFSILDCLYRKIISMGLNPIISTINNYARSNFGMSDAIIVSIQ